ncbi:hypothetical protein A9K58_04790 [Stenotrophomonas maltophilia]|uniref:Uncharacterized protein n=1 Tax=Stenotrophomonas maltophilia TaxID=40324 RepID=A0A1A6Y2N4_STEMA|nr:hypothetical protein [Stenotrophomonas maltophilia]OBU69051.1 hypothetical protein A9K58_04790 [Stenotrophomonas maltophilia]
MTLPWRTTFAVAYHARAESQAMIASFAGMTYMQQRHGFLMTGRGSGKFNCPTERGERTGKQANSKRQEAAMDARLALLLMGVPVGADPFSGTQVDGRH